MGWNQDTHKLGNIRNRKKCYVDKGSFVRQNSEDKVKKDCDKKVKDKVMGSEFRNSNGKSEIIRGKGDNIGHEGFELLSLAKISKRRWLLKKKKKGMGCCARASLEKGLGM